MLAKPRIAEPMKMAEDARNAPRGMEGRVGNTADPRVWISSFANYSTL